MPEITIRPLSEPDWPAWWALRLRCLAEHPDAFGQDYDEIVVEGEATSRNRYISFGIAGNNRIFGAFSDDGALVGSLGIVGNDRVKMRHRMEIWGVYVAPQARGGGTGRRLVETGIEHARQTDGVIQIHLTVSSHNEAAIMTYSRLGFTPYGHEPRALRLPDRFVDEDLMVLMLDTTSSK